MKPVLCTVKHDPAAGTYGDCIRACIASILELTAEQVPHFAFDDPGGEVANQRIREFLASHRLAPFWINYDGSISRDELLGMMGELNSGAVFMLYGRTDSGDHVVVCQGGEIVHDPSWYRSPLIGAGSHGFWTVLVLGRV